MRKELVWAGIGAIAGSLLTYWMMKKKEKDEE